MSLFSVLIKCIKSDEAFIDSSKGRRFDFTVEEYSGLFHYSY